MTVYSVAPGDLRIGEYEGGAYLTCPLCGPLWADGGIGGETLTAAGQLAERHCAEKHDPEQFPRVGAEGAWER